MGKVKKIGITIYIVSPLIALLIIGFYPHIWQELYPTESLHLIFNEIKNLYDINPLGLIASITALIGAVLLYYGTIVNSENRYSKSSVSVESRLKGFTFFSVILALILVGYFIKNLSNLFEWDNLIIAFFFLLIAIQQLIVQILFVSKLSNHYKYNNLLDLIKNREDHITKSLSYLRGNDEDEKFVGYPLVIFHLAWLFLFTYILLKTDISIILVVLLIWLVFISSTFIAIQYSIETARYFLVDIKFSDKTFKEAILIREEKGEFIRIIPKPNDDENRENEHNSILLNKSKIESIEYYKPDA